MRKFKQIASAAAALCLTAGLLCPAALADSSFTFTTPSEPMDVTGSADVLTTLTQRAGSEIPLVFGLNVVGGNMFTGLQYLGGTSVNENPDPYIWNFNYLYPDAQQMTVPVETAEGRTLPEGTFYKALGNTLNNPNGLYNSGGANQNYSVAMDELGGVGYAVGFRNDVIIGFNSQTVDQIDLVRSWREGDAFYQPGDEGYSPLVIDVQTGSVTSRMYAWTEMGQAISAYLAGHTGKTTRYGDPYTIAVNLEQFSAGIPYYIASLIADGAIAKKTAAYVSSIDGYTLTCVDPGTLGNVSADVYAEVHNFNFLTGSFTLSDLMQADADLIILGAAGYGYSGSTAGTVGGGQATTDSSKQDILADLVKLGCTAEELPLVMDAGTINVTIGTNGYNYAPTTPLLVPYVQAYAYMDELAAVNDAINPVAMLQYAVDEFCHVEESASADVALYYIGSNWDSVDEDYDRVPDLANYKYDKTAIAQAIQAGITYALSGRAAANGNTLLPAYRTTDNAYLILTEHTSAARPAEGSDYITLTLNGQTRYLDLTALAAGTGAEESEVIDGGTQFEYYNTRTEYQAIIDYYNSGEYGWGDDLQATLQKYADRMTAHVWQPVTTVKDTYGYGLGAAAEEPAFTDVAAGSFYAAPVAWAVEQGITNGTTASTFSPDAACTQGQILTFLWRAQGEPAPETAADSTKFYADAAQWAKEQGLIDTFAAEEPCTRAMVVTCLWRLAGSPEAEPSGFIDVPADCAQALAWAVEQGITNGVSDTSFAPAASCTRGQIVTFLYRAFAN